MWNKNHINDFSKIHKNIFLQIIAAIIILSIVQILFYKYQALKIEKEINFMGNSLAKKIEKNINMNSTILTAFGHSFDIDNDITKDRFNRLSQYYIERFPNILYLQHENRYDIIDMVYPLKGNEEILGKSLKNRLEVPKALNKAKKNRIIEVNDPYELKHLDYRTMGLIIRYPIFYNNEFNGYFMSAVDLNKFFSDIIHKDIKEKYYISISDASGNEFYKTDSESKGYIFRTKINIEDNYWTITVGSHTNYKGRIMFSILLIVLIAVFLFTALFYMEFKISIKDKSIDDLINLEHELKQEIENRKIVEEDLSKLTAIIESSKDAILRLNIKGEIVTWNNGAEKVYGHKQREVKGKNISILIPKNKIEETFDILDMVKLGNDVGYYETERIKSNGEKIHVTTTISPIRDRNKQIIGFSEIAKDITEHKKMEQNLKDSYEELSAVYQQLSAAEEELRVQFDELKKNDELLKKSEERNELVISASLDGIYDWDIKNNHMYRSKSWKEMLDYNEDELTDYYEIWESFIHPEDKKRVVDEMNKYLNREIDNYIIEYRFRKKDGSYILIKDKGVAIWDENGKPIRMAGTLKNIDDQKKWEDKIFDMAYYDPLTKLPNRILFEEKLNTALNKAVLGSQKGAVFFIDLDNFKNINDSLGHEFGDKLIEQIGKEIQSCLGEKGIVSRFGGDEFLILQPKIDCSSDSTELANRILKTLNNPWMIGKHQIYITASIGIAIFPEDGINVNEILKNADTAMYKAKTAGKNKYQLFQRLMSDEIVRKTEIENALRNALRNDEFLLYYQPQVDLKTGRIVSFEALIRWRHPEWGIVPPNEFIPIAEEMGLIIQIGKWVLRNACRQNKEWKYKGYSYDSIAVNVSSVQLQHRGFLDSIKEVLNENNLEPQFLELEITESILMKYIDWNIKVLSGLKNMGVKIAIDDFGTGYSSLNYLKDLPIHSIKIDKSFIDGIYTNSNEQSIVEGIILLAHKMNLDVIAEGVEIKEQLEILKEKQCNKVQGYYLSKPYPAWEIERLAKKGYFDL